MMWGEGAGKNIFLFLVASALYSVTYKKETCPSHPLVHRNSACRLELNLLF